MYKINILILSAISAVTFLGCAAKKQVNYEDEYVKTRASLAEASYAVSRSMVDLAEVAQAAYPMSHVDSPPDPATYGMGGTTTVDWSGPVEPLLRQIARASDYRVRVLGTPPAIPVIITMYEKRVKLGDALRDIGYQCGKRAAVIIFPESRVIELRYAKN